VRLLDAREVAERLNVPATWPLRAARELGMPHVRLGHYVRFDWPEVEAWIEEQKRAGRNGR
jgi:excisionase family DNA binding protein